MTTIKEHEELTKTKTNNGVENKRTKERANEITKQYTNDMELRKQRMNEGDKIWTNDRRK